MARKRMIDPSIWADQDFGTMTAEEQILFIGMVSNADDEGRLPGNALYLTSTILPYKGLTSAQATKLRDTVVQKMGSLVLYEVGGKEYLQFLKWKTYQSINKPTGSNYPPLPKGYRSATATLPPNRIEKNRKEEKRIEGARVETFNTLESLQNNTLIEEIATLYSVPIKFVAETHEELVLYCKSTGKKYANYKAALMNWVRRKKAERPNDFKHPKETWKPEYEGMATGARVLTSKDLEDDAPRSSK